MSLSNNKTVSKIDSELLSEYILFKYGPMSHLKLQKLLYYVQAFHLAYFDSPLIDDDFEAWLHGPVSKKIFNTVKEFSVLYNDVKYEGPSEIEDSVKHLLSTEQFDLINEVLTEYAALTGTQLENLTHSEEPWINARNECGFGDACREIIPKTIMSDYYKDKMYGKNS